MSDFDELQKRIKSRMFCIGWRQEDSQVKHYYHAIFDSWHEANSIACDASTPGTIPFVEAVMVTQKCSRCDGTGHTEEDRVGKDTSCTHCHGRGEVRAST